MSQHYDTFLEPQPPECMPPAERSLLRGAAITLGTASLFLGLSVILLAGAIALVFRLLTPPEQVVARLSSPDNKWELVEIEADHGGLGGEVRVELEPLGRGSGDSRIVAVHGSWGARPTLAWDDSGTFSIDGREADVSDTRVLHLDD